MVRIGVCNWILPEFGEPECCPLLRELGICGVQLDSGGPENGYPLLDSALQKRWQELAAQNGVTITALMVNAVMAHGLTRPPGREETDIAWEATENAIAMAEAMHVPLVIIPSFRASEISTEADLERTAAFFRKAGEHLRTRKSPVSLVTENVLLPERMRALQRLVGAPELRLYPDSFNYFFWTGLSLPTVLAELLPLCVDEIHFKDGTTQDTGSRLLGKGMGEAEPLLAALQARGYSGYVYIENFYTRPAFDGQGRAPLDLLREDIATIRRHFTPS